MHLIQKHHIDVQCSEKPFAHLLKDELSGFFEHELYPKLEKLLDRYDASGRVWSIDYLSVDIPTISKQNWKQELVDNILFQIEEFLKKEHIPHAEEKKQPKQSTKAISQEESTQELLLYYLQNGTLPVNALVENLEALFNTVQTDDVFSKRLKSFLKEDISAVLRWSLNIPHSIKQPFCEEIGIGTSWERIRYFLKESWSPSLKGKNIKQEQVYNFGLFLFWLGVFRKGTSIPMTTSEIETVLNYASTHFELPPNAIQYVIMHWKSNTKAPDLRVFVEEVSYINNYLEANNWVSIQQQKAKTKKENVDDIQAILEALQGKKEEVNTTPMSSEANYIENAGLVILHPFLVPLFQKLEYLEDSDWKSTALQHRAVLLLQYMRDFNDRVFESDLLLNKILCGVDPTETVATDWKIAEIEKEQCEKLLLSVIEHWKILKNTSIGTFQETFLQRNGRMLEYKENTYELTVEQKGLDILLDQLPWGIGTIKTPWMEHYLSCYWN